jgi:hypothetical protein
MPRARKHYLLYARQNWRDARVLVALIAFGYVAVGLFELSRHNLPVALQFLIPAPLALLFLPLLWAWTRINYVAFEEEGVFIRIFLRAVRVPWEVVERARVETLERIFEAPERRRLRSGIVRRLYRQKAVCVRVREDDAPNLRRKLGARTIPARELVLPVTEEEAAMAEIKQRLTAARREERAAESATRAPRGRGQGRRRR